MDFQTAFNITLALAGALAGYVLKMTQTALRDLTKSDAELVERVQAIEVLVAGKYVRREDLDRMAGELFRKLDRIEDKLDTKVDK